jgi:hypothetical protein
VLGPYLRGWLQQAAAQVLELAYPGGGHGKSAPAAGCAVEYGPGDADTAGLAGEAADNLCATAGFAEGPFDEVRVSDAVMMFGREPQISGQALAIGQHDLHRCRVGGCVAGSERAQPGVDEFDQPRAGLGGELGGVEAGLVAIAEALST